MRFNKRTPDGSSLAVAARVSALPLKLPISLLYANSLCDDERIERCAAEQAFRTAL